MKSLSFRVPHTSFWPYLLPVCYGFIYSQLSECFDLKSSVLVGRVVSTLNSLLSECFDLKSSVLVGRAVSTLNSLLSECFDLKEMPPVARGLRGMLQRPVKNAAIPFP